MFDKIQIRRLIKENIELIIIFVLSTAFFIFQNKINLSWDFSSYVLNAKYLFYDGIYFEVYRPILPPLLFGFFLLFGELANPLYIILVSALFLYGNIALADVIFEKSKVGKRHSRFFFYAFSMGFFALYYGLFAGTELLSLAFFEMFIAFVIKGKTSGHFLGLAILSRYNFIPYSIFLIFNKSYKKIILNILTFIAVLFPWLLFNYIKFGNWFTSIIDSYALNVAYRQSMIEPFDPYMLVRVIGIFAPFLILGLISCALNFKKEKLTSKHNLITLFLVLITAMILSDFNSIPLKFERYLFNLTLPIAFFSTHGTIYLIGKIKKLKKPLTLIILAIFLFTVASMSTGFYHERNWDDRFYSASEQINSLGLQDCRILSPHWVPVHYLTGNVYPLGGNTLSGTIYRNEIALIFKDRETMDDYFTQEEIDQSPKLFENEEFVMLAKENLTNETCAKKYIYEPTVTEDPCETISERFENTKISEQILAFCHKINNI